MENSNDQYATINLIKLIVDKHGCKILDIDLDNHVLNIDGPEEAQIACAQELEAVLN